MWQMTLRSSEMVFYEELYATSNLFNVPIFSCLANFVTL